MPIGSQVVILGGGLVGLELAEFLVERGRQVTVLEEGSKFGLEMAHPRRWRVLDDLRSSGVSLVSNAVVRTIDEKEVVYEIASGTSAATVHRTPADSVLVATGLEADAETTRSLRATGVPIREIGDASGPGYLEGAIHDGFHAAFEL